MVFTGEQLRGARAMVRIDQAELAASAGCCAETIKRLERTSGQVSANVNTLSAIVRALERVGIAFVAESDGVVGIRFRRPENL